MKFLFLGAGAVGTYVGGCLAEVGESVAYVERPEVIASLRGRGLVVHRGATTHVETDLTFFESVADAAAAGSYDVCVVALKSFDTRGAAEDIRASGLDAAVLSLQNGVDNEAVLGEVLGADRVIWGTVTSAIAKTGTGVVVEETHRGIGIATGHPLAPRIIGAIGAAGLGVHAYDNALQMKYSKLITNLIGNAQSAILDESVHDVLADRRSYDTEIAALRECLAVMRALGFGPINLPGTPVRALALAASVPRLIAQPIMVKFMGDARGHKMPSLHIDLHAGRGQTEVEWINGGIVRHGREVGVPTPVNALLTRVVQQLTTGEASSTSFRHHPDALARLL